MTKSFDDRAQTWDDDPRRGQLAADVFAALARAVPLRPDMAALDVGAGTGLLTLALAPRVRRVVAVDSSAGMLDVLRRKAQAADVRNVDLFQADVAAGPLPPGPYDLVAAAMTLHHVADVDALFRKFHALLAPGGFLALADLEAEDGSFHADSAGIPHFGFDRGEFAKRLAAAGFADVHVADATRISKNAREYPVFLAAARKPA